MYIISAVGHVESTAQMLRLGANPNIQDRKGRTPAHCAASKGQFEAMKILESNNADFWMSNVRGDLPLHDAVHSGRKDLVRWLLKMKPDGVNAGNQDGKCPLHIAALNNNVEMSKESFFKIPITLDFFPLNLFSLISK